MGVCLCPLSLPFVCLILTNEMSNETASPIKWTVCFRFYTTAQLHNCGTFSAIKSCKCNWRVSLLKWFNWGYSCFQAEVTNNKRIWLFVTWFAPVLVFIHIHLGIYFNQHTLNLRDKLLRPFTENVEKVLGFPSRWRIFDKRNNLSPQIDSSGLFM